MHPLAEKLARQFISDFWSADHDIRWTAIEQEHQLWLSPNVLLVGRIDGEGDTPDGDSFFGDWKTLSASKASRMEEEKAKWRTNPQALTYGVLRPHIRRFTVRWVVKPKVTKKDGEGPITTDFEWYEYSPAEIEFWREQLLDLGNEILDRRRSGRWTKNRGNCYRYGINYACPFLETCHKLDFTSSLGHPRVPHLDFERVNKFDPSVVIIDSSRISDYLECPESYRRTWEGEGFQEENENLTVGSDFHTIIASHLMQLKGENDSK